MTHNLLIYKNMTKSFWTHTLFYLFYSEATGQETDFYTFLTIFFTCIGWNTLYSKWILLMHEILWLKTIENHIFPDKFLWLQYDTKVTSSVKIEMS